MSESETEKKIEQFHLYSLQRRLADSPADATEIKFTRSEVEEVSQEVNQILRE